MRAVVRPIVCAVLGVSLGCTGTPTLSPHAWTVPESCQRVELDVRLDAEGARYLTWPTLKSWLDCANARGGLGPLVQWLEQWQPDEREAWTHDWTRAVLNPDQDNAVQRWVQLWAVPLPDRVTAHVRDAGQALVDILGQQQWLKSLARLQEMADWGRAQGQLFSDMQDFLGVTEIVEQALEQPWLIEAVDRWAAMEAGPGWESGWHGVQAAVRSGRSEFNPWDEAMRLLGSGPFLSTMRKIWGPPDQAKSSLADAILLFEEFLFVGTPGRSWLDRMGRLLTSLDRPMVCFGGKIKIPNAARAALKELAWKGPQDPRAAWARRDFKMRVLLSREVCDQVGEGVDDTEALSRLATTEALWPVQKFLTHMEPKMMDWLLQTLAHPQWQTLQPLFRWMAHHQLWGDLLIMTSWFAESERPRVERFFESVRKFQPQLRQTVLAADSGEAFEFLIESARVLKRHRTELGKILEVLRWSLRSSSRNEASAAREQAAWPNTVNWKLLQRTLELPAGPPSLEFIKKGFAENRWTGILRDFLQWTQSGRSQTWHLVDRGVAPPTHRLSQNDIKRSEFKSLPGSPDLEACDRLRLHASMREQIADVWSCLGRGPWRESPANMAAFWRVWDGFRDDFRIPEHPLFGVLERFLKSEQSNDFFETLGTWGQTHEAQWRTWVDLWSMRPIPPEELGTFLEFLADGLNTWTNVQRAQVESRQGTASMRPDPQRITALRLATVPWLHQVECMFHPVGKERRLREIESDFLERVHVEDLDAGATKVRFAPGEFETRVRELLGQIRAHPAILDALTRFLAKRPDFMQWISLWLSDVQPMMAYAPGAMTPHVRWASSLDLLELLGIHSDVSFLTSKNYSYFYMGLIAEAWGDVPRAQWPAEIQRKYRSSEPRKLKDVVAMIEAEAVTFENNAGYPADVSESWRPCSALDREANVVPRYKTSPWWSGWATDDLRRHSFMLRQALPLLVQNLPGSGHAQAGGLEVLRDLLWELVEATPRADRHASSGDRHAFSVVRRFSKLGLGSWGLKAWKGVSADHPMAVDFRNGLSRWTQIEPSLLRRLLVDGLRAADAMNRWDPGQLKTFAETWIDWVALMGRLPNHPGGQAQEILILSENARQVLPWLEALLDTRSDRSSVVRAFEWALHHAYLLPRTLAWEDLEWIAKYPQAGRWSLALFEAMGKTAGEVRPAEVVALDPVLLESFVTVAKAWIRDPEGARQCVEWLERDPESVAVWVRAWFDAARNGVWAEMLDSVRRGQARSF